MLLSACKVRHWSGVAGLKMRSTGRGGDLSSRFAGPVTVSVQGHYLEWSGRAEGTPCWGSGRGLGGNMFFFWGGLELQPAAPTTVSLQGHHVEWSGRTQGM